MSYNAFRCLPIVDPVSGKVEAMDTYESEDCERLYVGTSDGNILLYHVKKEPTAEGEQRVGSLETRKSLGHGRKPVEQLLAFGPVNKLVVLCDGNVTLHDLASLELRGADRYRLLTY